MSDSFVNDPECSDYLRRLTPRKTKINYNEHFAFVGSGDNKEGCCLHCGLDIYGNYIKVIPMKSSNTSGLLYHLKQEHEPIYQRSHVEQKCSIDGTIAGQLSNVETGEFSQTSNADRYASGPPRKKKRGYTEHFEFGGAGKDKVGFCLHCGKDAYGNYVKVVKMKNSNTSGLLSHLRTEHKPIYEEFYGGNVVKEDETEDNSRDFVPDFDGMPSMGLEDTKNSAVGIENKDFYDEYFDIRISIDGIEGCCINCGKSEHGDYSTIIKMENFQTVELLEHLRNVHPEIYDAACYQNEAKASVAQDFNKTTTATSTPQRATKKGSGIYDSHFEFHTMGKLKLGYCLHCGKNEQGVYKKIIRMKGGNTSGLISHLSKEHPDIYVRLFKERQCTRKMRESIRPYLSQLANADSSRQYEPSCEVSLFELSGDLTNISEDTATAATFLSADPLAPTTPRDFDRATVDWIARKCLPMDFFEDRETRDFFRLVALMGGELRLPNRQEMSKLLKSEFDLLEANLAKRLSELVNSKLSFSLDALTIGDDATTTTSFYVVTCYFVDRDWRLRSVVLGVTQQSDCETATNSVKNENLANFFVRTLEKFDAIDRIMGVTIDESVVDDGSFAIALEKSLLRQSRGVRFDAGYQLIRCFARTINNGVLDMLKTVNCSPRDSSCEEEEGEEDELRESGVEFGSYELISSSVRNLRAIVRKLGESKRLRAELERRCRSESVVNFSSLPEMDDATKCDSTYAMINSALALKPTLVGLCEDFGGSRASTLTDSQWETLKKLKDCLKICHQVSEKISREKDVNLPTAVVSLNLLIDKIECLSGNLDKKCDRSATDESLVKALRDGRDRIVKDYDRDNWLFGLSLILDPRHKIESFDLTGWGKKLKVDSVERCKSLLKVYDERVGESASDKVGSEVTSKRKADDLFDDEIDFDSFYAQPKKLSAWEKEFVEYLQSDREPFDCDMLLWWRQHEAKYPRLAAIAKDVLAVAAVSRPAEKIFPAEVTEALARGRQQQKSASGGANDLTNLMCVNAWIDSDLKERDTRGYGAKVVYKD